MVLGGPPYNPRKELTLHLQSRFQGALDAHQRSLDEIKACRSEMTTLLDEKSAINTRWHEEHQKLLTERDRLLQVTESLRAWGSDLQCGNLELQEFQRKYQDAHARLLALEDEHRRLRADHHALASQLSAPTPAPAPAPPPAPAPVPAPAPARNQPSANGHANANVNGGGDGHSNGTDQQQQQQQQQSRSLSREELDNWVMERWFRDGAMHEGKLTALMDGIEGANWKDMHGRLHTLKAHLAEMHRERRLREAEWRRLVGRRSLSPLPPPPPPPPLPKLPLPPPPSDASADADGEAGDKGDGRGDATDGANCGGSGDGGNGGGGTGGGGSDGGIAKGMLIPRCAVRKQLADSPCLQIPRLRRRRRRRCRPGTTNLPLLRLPTLLHGLTLRLPPRSPLLLPLPPLLTVLKVLPRLLPWMWPALAALLLPEGWTRWI